MALFRKDAAAMLGKARAELAAAETKNAELAAKRGAALLDADVAAIDAIDRQLEAGRRMVGIHTDRIAALGLECRQQETEQREQRRAVAIRAIGKRLKERQADAVELEGAISRVAELFAAVASDGGLKADWPFPYPPYVSWSANDVIAAAVLGALHVKTRAAGAGLFPQSLWSALNRTISLDGIAAKVSDHSDRLLAALQDLPLPEPAAADDDDLSEEAA